MTTRRVVCIGGGPSGLLLGILLHRNGLGEVTVHERNATDDTFGFGVVFSDETLANLRSADPLVFERIENEMRAIVKQDFPVVREEMDREEATRFFRGQGEDYKAEIIAGLPDQRVGLYRQGEFIDLCRGPHVPSTGKLKVGDPSTREAFMGTVIDKGAYEDYQKYMAQARQDGQVLFGGSTLTDGDYAKGYYVQPAIVAGLPEDHPLVKNELFLPILHVAKVGSVEEGMRLANDTQYGLTAGFFSEDEQEAHYFLDNVQAGTVYVNRASGATTGAWPGIQAFGGWKGSGMSGKGVGGLYTLPLYMHEQSQTWFK